MSDFARDPNDWLRKLSPDEWIRAGLGELQRAEEAYAHQNPRAAIAGCKRAAGMALNAALIVLPNEAWGRTYVEHVTALSKDAEAPERVRVACKAILTAHAPSPGLVSVRSASLDARVVEATKDVIAHAYAIVKRRDGGAA